MTGPSARWFDEYIDSDDEALTREDVERWRDIGPLVTAQERDCDNGMYDEDECES